MSARRHFNFSCINGHNVNPLPLLPPLRLRKNIFPFTASMCRCRQFHYFLLYKRSLAINLFDCKIYKCNRKIKETMALWRHVPLSVTSKPLTHFFVSPTAPKKLHKNRYLAEALFTYVKLNSKFFLLSKISIQYTLPTTASVTTHIHRKMRAF